MLANLVALLGWGAYDVLQMEAFGPSLAWGINQDNVEKRACYGSAVRSLGEPSILSYEFQKEV